MRRGGGGPGAACVLAGNAHSSKGIHPQAEGRASNARANVIRHMVAKDVSHALQSTCLAQVLDLGRFQPHSHVHPSLHPF
jgi:hypothetical protein